MKELESFVKEYHECLNKQSFIQKDLDYSAIEKYKPTLKQLSLLGNTGISVFDLAQKENVYTSYNFNTLFGYDQDEMQKNSEFFNSRIHPEDITLLIRHYIEFTNFLYTLSKEERGNYKLLNQFRVLNTSQKYIELVEQYQVLESDKNGNVWLGLAITDISPDQNHERAINAQILNFKTGDYFPIESGTRKTALLQKEIASSLSSNLLKVNSQRKKMLEKINADNVMEAIKRVAKLGLVD
jgi:hypothetical protein